MLAPGWIESEIPADALPSIAFARQCVPNPEPIRADSIAHWGQTIGRRLIDELGDHQDRWRLHLFGLPSSEVRSGRIKLIDSAVRDFLEKKHRRLLRSLIGDPLSSWTDQQALVQVVLRDGRSGWTSRCPPAERVRLRRCLSRFPGGLVKVPEDRRAPSRAYRKLLEAEQELGRRIEAGETCVDLGASPGSWSYVALGRGASVVAVDRSPLRKDLMRHPGLTFVRGDAFRYLPTESVQWLLSDVIAFPARIIELLDRWLSESLCRHFCVTVKFRGRDDYPRLEDLKGLLVRHRTEFIVRRLESNKNEVTAIGSASG